MERKIFAEKLKAHKKGNFSSKKFKLPKAKLPKDYTGTEKQREAVNLKQKNRTR